MTRWSLGLTLVVEDLSAAGIQKRAMELIDCIYQNEEIMR